MVQSNIKPSTNSVKGNIILEFSDLKFMKIQKKTKLKYKVQRYENIKVSGRIWEVVINIDPLRHRNR